MQTRKDTEFSIRRWTPCVGAPRPQTPEPRTKTRDPGVDGLEHANRRHEPRALALYTGRTEAKCGNRIDLTSVNGRASIERESRPSAGVRVRQENTKKSRVFKSKCRCPELGGSSRRRLRGRWSRLGLRRIGRSRIEFRKPKDVGAIIGLELATREHAEQTSVLVVDLQFILFNEPNCLVIGRVKAASAKEIIPD